MEVVQIPVLSDNYNFLLHCSKTHITAAVDPSESQPILKELSTRSWNLDMILLTHHHWDHIGGVQDLKRAFNCFVTSSQVDGQRIANVDRCVEEGDSFSVGNSLCEVLFLPGHTAGHVGYHFPSMNGLFSGDVLFAAGCGRLFEGTPQQMYRSLQKIAQLPDPTKIYCAHEYTLNNIEFALAVEPNNESLKLRYEKVKQQRDLDLPTVPTVLGLEKLTNPFLRTHSQEIRRNLHLLEASDEEVFTELRRRKDIF